MEPQRATGRWVVAAIAIFGMGQLWAAHRLTAHLTDSSSDLSGGVRLLALGLVTLMVIAELYAAVSGTQSG